MKVKTLQMLFAQSQSTSVHSSGTPITATHLGNCMLTIEADQSFVVADLTSNSSTELFPNLFEVFGTDKDCYGLLTKYSLSKYQKAHKGLVDYISALEVSPSAGVWTSRNQVLALFDPLVLQSDFIMSWQIPHEYSYCISSIICESISEKTFLENVVLNWEMEGI